MKLLSYEFRTSWVCPIVLFQGVKGQEKKLDMFKFCKLKENLINQFSYIGQSSSELCVPQISTYLSKNGQKAFNLIILQRKQNQIKSDLLTVSVRIFNELNCVLLSLHTSSESLKLLSSKHPFPGHSTSMLTKLRLQARSCMRPLTICNTLSGSQVWFAERGGNIYKNNWVLGTVYILGQ